MRPILWCSCGWEVDDASDGLLRRLQVHLRIEAAVFEHWAAGHAVSCLVEVRELVESAARSLVRRKRARNLRVR